VIQPRVIRAKDAPKYLGVDKNRFYLEIKPRLRPVKMPGAKSRAIGYDRLELDAWWEEYKAVGRSKEDEWNAKSQTVSSGDQKPGGGFYKSIYFKKMYRGHFLRDSCKTSDPEEAKRKLRKWMTGIDRSGRFGRAAEKDFQRRRR
jgi:predicted DNA-binding transcriptional regulator AlpA